MTPEDDPLVRDEEQAAAAEAARIGGDPGDMDIPPEERPLAEAGQGVAEGFEQAEADLIDHAEHTTGEGAPRLERLASDEQAHELPSYGEPDQEDVTEITTDPQEDRADDPGEGPGLAADR